MSTGVLVVAPGWVAGEHIRAFQANPHAHVAGIAVFRESERERAAKYIDEFGLEDCRVSDDYRKALASDDVGAVTVCSINQFHYEHALAAIEAGKHVMVEKPFAMTPLGVSRLCDAADKAGVVTMAGHIVRYYPAIRGLKGLADKGALGEVFHVEADYWHELSGGWKASKRTAGSAMLMGGIHALDLVRYFIGEDRKPETVSAVWSGPFRRKDFDYKPNLTALIRFEGELTARVGVSVETPMPYVFHFQANGTRGAIRNNRIHSPEFFPGVDGFAEVSGAYPDDWNVACHPFQEEIDDFVSSVRSGKPGMLDIRNARATYELLFAIEKAARENTTVAGEKGGGFCLPF